MKKSAIILGLILTQFSFSQVTDTGDKVGIGTTNPQYGKLHIFGNGPDEGINLWTSSGGFTSRIWIDDVERTLHISRGNNALNGITIDNNGLVGIGTTNPDQKLTVQGNVNIGGTGNYHLKTRHIDGKEVSSTNIGDLYLNYNTGKRVIVGFGGQDSSLIVSGKMGVGTSNPSEQLTVTGNIETQTNNGKIGFNVSDIALINGLERPRYGLSTYGANPTSLSGYFGLSFITADNIRMKILNNGNVGIGTTDTKGFKLGVQGKIAAEEVKVANYDNWSDFVFNDNYTLPSLKEVENHIKNNGHLENIPSAKEVAKNGFFLAEMDSKLLQKIEELTLYTIEQQKEIEEQNKAFSKKIEELEKENELLKSLIKRVKSLEEILNP